MTGHRLSSLGSVLVAAALTAAIVAACSSPLTPAPASGSSSQPANPAVLPTTTGPVAATPQETAAAQDSLVGDDAALLKQLRGTYLCDQRIYPSPPGPHITAWEWSFTVEPDTLADQLATKLPGATRDGRTFRFEGEQGTGVVVDVRDGTRSLLQCEVPAATRALVVVSQG